MKTTKAKKSGSWFLAIKEGRATVYVDHRGPSHCREYETAAQVDDLTAQVTVGGRSFRVTRRVTPIGILNGARYN